MGDSGVRGLGRVLSECVQLKKETCMVVRWWVVAQNNDMDPACVTTYCHKELSGVGTTYCCYSSQQNNQIRLLETEI